MNASELTQALVGQLSHRTDLGQFEHLKPLCEALLRCQNMFDANGVTADPASKSQSSQCAALVNRALFKIRQ